MKIKMFNKYYLELCSAKAHQRHPFPHHFPRIHNSNSGSHSLRHYPLGILCIIGTSICLAYACNTVCGTPGRYASRQERRHSALAVCAEPWSGTGRAIWSGRRPLRSRTKNTHTQLCVRNSVSTAYCLQYGFYNFSSYSVRMGCSL